MILAVASGKGGTGKTTVATNLAMVCAMEGKPTQYLDCDVEEPNGHLFLEPRIIRREAVTVEVPEVDTTKCTGCGRCGEMCQYSAITCIGDQVLTFERLCHSCLGCWLVCPAEAIGRKPLRVGEIEMGEAEMLDFVSGRLEIGHVRTPSLIRSVRKHVRPEALAIVDVPPGTSCPVVTALRHVDFVLLVTEPTPFGLNDLKLAVGLVHAMKLPFSVVINRDGIGNHEMQSYCEAEGIRIAARIPEDRRIAQAYSSGQMIVETLPEYANRFGELARTLGVLA